MDTSYWHKQATNTPLYPDLLWSRPENRAQAGNLLVIGGSAQGFSAAAEAYQLALSAGIGNVRVLLPESLKKVIGRTFEAGEFAPATTIGSFSQKALASFVDLSLWSDGVLIAGDVGRNSETAIVLEHFLDRYDGQVTLTKDAADLICQQPLAVLQRPNTVLVLSAGQLQRFGSNAHFARAFVSTAALLQLVENLHECTKRFQCTIITKHHNVLVLASNGEITTTPLAVDRPIWRLTMATTAATWWLQNPTKMFQALTVAISEVANLC